MNDAYAKIEVGDGAAVRSFELADWVHRTMPMEARTNAVRNQMDRRTSQKAHPRTPVA